MKIAAVDIECTDLKAFMGRLLCCSFKPIIEGKRTKPYTLSIADFKADDPIDDSKLAVAIRDEIEKYDLIVTWNGKLFDIPFVNARLSVVGERPVATKFHLDGMYYARGCSMRIGSSKLDNVAKFYKLKEQKTPLDWETWKRAAISDEKALQQVISHCEADVKTLAEAYPYILPHVRNLHR